MLVNLAEKRKELAEKITELRSLNKEVFSDSEKEQYDTFTGTIEQLKAYIDREF